MPTYTKVQGFAEQGGAQIDTQGLLSTDLALKIYASATITVYAAGTTTPSTIYSDSGGTAKSNPFTADATGFWFFYVADGVYDVRFSGGGMASPITRGGITVGIGTLPANIAYTDVANVFTEDQRINGKLGFNMDPISMIDLLDSSPEIHAFASDDTAGTSRVRLENSDNLAANLVQYAPNFSGTVYAGLDFADLSEVFSNAPNLSIRQAGSNGSIWFGTNNTFRALLNATALKLAKGLPLQLQGATSGSAFWKAQAVAGSYTFLPPNIDPIVGQLLRVSAFSGGNVTFDYGSGGSGSGTLQGICRYDVQRDYGASGSALTTTGNISAGTNTLNLAAALDFVNGQGVLVKTVGTASKHLVTSIVSGAGTTTLILADNAVLPGTGVTVQHDDSAAINTAIAAIVAAGGGAMVFPAGRYRCNGALDATCNSILHLPQITRISGSPVSISLIGEMVGPVTGSSILQTYGTIIDSQDFDGTASNLSAIISAKAYANTGTVGNTTFNYTQLIIENMTLRNKPNPFLGGVQCNNGEGLIMRNCVIDAGEPLTFTSAGFTVNTQPTHTTAVGVTTPGLNNICNNYLENVIVIGYYAAFNVGDNLRFGGGVYSIQNDTGLLCHGNAAMAEGPIGIYLTKNPIVVDNTLGVQSTFALNLEMQIINTGAWYDVAANRTIYDPLNIAIGEIRGVMPGFTGFTGCGLLDILDTYNKTYYYRGTAPLMDFTGSSSGSAGNQIALRNDSANYGVISVSGSADPTTNLRNRLHVYANKGVILTSLDATNTIEVRVGGDSAADDIATFDPFFTIGRTTLRGITKVTTAQLVANYQAQITTNVNDFSPGAGSLQFWNTDANHNITGMAAGQPGEEREIWNNGVQNWVLTNQDALSTAANRWLTTTGANLTVTPNQCVKVRYDGTGARWRAILQP